MNVSKQEAQDSLNEIQATVDRTRKAIAEGITSHMLILWGMVWVLGYAATQFLPWYADYIWFALILLGVTISSLIGARTRPRLKYGSNHKRVGLAWLILLAYAFLWLYLLHPNPFPGGAISMSNYEPLTGSQVGAFFATVTMFAYVVLGLWLGRLFLTVGLSVTALTLIGFWFIPNWFNLWMAMTAGGSLVFTGLFIRTYWK